MNMNGAPSSDPRTNVSHQVSVDPVDDTGINVSNLEERGHLGVPGTTINPNHVSHAPGTFCVGDDHGHACLWCGVARGNCRTLGLSCVEWDQLGQNAQNRCLPLKLLLQAVSMLYVLLFGRYLCWQLSSFH